MPTPIQIIDEDYTKRYPLKGLERFLIDEYENADDGYFDAHKRRLSIRAIGRYVNQTIARLEIYIDSETKFRHRSNDLRLEATRQLRAAEESVATLKKENRELKKFKANLPFSSKRMRSVVAENSVLNMENQTALDIINAYNRIPKWIRFVLFPTNVLVRFQVCKDYPSNLKQAMASLDEHVEFASELGEGKKEIADIRPHLGQNVDTRA